MPRKDYEAHERRYVPEYVTLKYPDKVTVFYNASIGPPPEELWKAHPEIPFEYFRSWRFYADAVVVLKDRVVIVEGKIRKPADGLGQLLMYKALVPLTPELRPYAGLSLQLLLVMPRADPRIVGVAQTLGITVDVYNTPWLTEYLKRLNLA